MVQVPDRVGVSGSVRNGFFHAGEVRERTGLVVEAAAHPFPRLLLPELRDQ
jgi:hypothetical protein